ncbi:MliC family protein [Pseudomonas sp. F1_0610]|uniref:MliC family protein n=1 Tax=Pseudomonas sp. F1_0610 TaxID=3114284 RepID=UPI0039C4CCC1
MKKYALILGLATAVLAQPSFAAEVKQVVFKCDRAISLPVTFVNDKQSFAVVTVDGRQLLLTESPSGSGAVYTSADKNLPYSLSTKNDNAFVNFGDSTILENCVSK